MIVVARWVIHVASVTSGKQSVIGVARRDTCKKFCRNKSAAKPVYRKLPSKGRKPVRCMEEGLETPSEEDDNQEELYTIHSASKSRPYVATINVDGESMQMEIDTGASLSLVSEREFQDTWPEREVSTTDITRAQ